MIPKNKAYRRKFMKTVIFTPDGTANFTPKVISALSEMKDGGEIRFEKGEYHFYEEGTFEKFFAPTNNTNCVKKIAFPIIGMKNVTIDGGDSLFVFHGKASTFIVSHSENITIKNFTRTMDHLPYILMKIGKIDDNGFELIMHPDTDYEVDENGYLIFNLGNRKMGVGGCGYSIHSIDTLAVTYLFTGANDQDKSALAASHYETVAEPIEGGVYCRYTKIDPATRAIRCAYKEGEKLSIITEGRSRTLIFMEESSDVTVSNVTVKCETGMGILGQCCHNVNIDGFRVCPSEEVPAAITADALHFVNCTGLLDIRNCENTKSMDDYLNVHGMYTTVTEVLENGIKVRVGHWEQALFLPYHDGDKLWVIDPDTLDIKGTITSKDYEFVSQDGRDAVVNIKNPENLSFVKVGDLIDDGDRMPDLNFVGNKGIDIPRVLMAGGKRYYYANNELRGFIKALSANDVPKYWYESGRLGELIVENNIFEYKRAPGKSSVIDIGIAGFKPENAPKVHGKVVIRNNKFIGAGPDPIINVFGVKELIIENNSAE